MKKYILLPLVGILLSSLCAEEWLPLGARNYYNERPWLLPPSDYYYYWSPAVRSYSYDYYANRYYRDPWGPAPIHVYAGRITAPSLPGAFSPPKLPLREAPLPAYPGTNYDYRYRDFDWVGGRPIVGYLDLEWGSSFSQFIRRYPDAVEVTQDADRVVNVRRFLQEPINDTVESRQFVFSQDRLYEVYVLYGYVDPYTTDSFGEHLASVYGAPITTQYRESRTAQAYFNMADHYMNYNRNLQVVYTVADVYNYYHVKLGTIMTCLYVNLPIKAEVERARQNFR